MKKLLPTLFITFISLQAFSQVTVRGGSTATRLARVLVDSTSATISGATLNCAANARGTFTATASTGLGIPDGVLLTTGDVGIVGRANWSSGAGIDNGMAGDVGLTAWAGRPTNNACILEFDVTPLFDTLFVKYAFASEEYPEFVGGPYNDVFGFFLTSGPGVSGVINFAYVPGTVLPVCVNNVNPTLNSAYYVDNSGGRYIEYDGYTKRLEAKVILAAGGTYHLRIGIADGTDGIYDSGVFIQSKSIRSKMPPLAVPVEVLNFYGERSAKNESLQLKWTTASDKGNAYFEVERSSDGKTFSTVGKVDAIPGQTERVYTLMDDHSDQAEYYRLKVTDQSGHSRYLKLFNVPHNTVQNNFQFYPSPLQFGKDLTIQTEGMKGHVSIQVYDQLGRVMLNHDADNKDDSSEFTIRTNSLPKGNYFIRVNSDTETLTRHFIID